MKFDVKVIVDNDELSDTLETTQVLILTAKMLGIELNSEYVEGMDNTYEFRYNFELTKDIVSKMKEQQNNLDISTIFS